MPVKTIPAGQTWEQLQERLSIDLQRGFHGAWLKQWQRWGLLVPSFTEVGAAFRATCI